MPISAVAESLSPRLIMGESTPMRVTLQTRTREVRETGRRMRADSGTR
jgi:hypothetical protein